MDSICFPYAFLAGMKKPVVSYPERDYHMSIGGGLAITLD